MNVKDCTANVNVLLSAHLPGWRVTYSKSKRVIGRCWHSEKRIELSRYMVEANDWSDVRETVLHEIAHALVGVEKVNGRYSHHGPKWKAQARKLGLNDPKATRTPVARIPYRYEAHCNTHGVIGGQHRSTERMSKVQTCKLCSRKFDPKFAVWWVDTRTGEVVR